MINDKRRAVRGLLALLGITRNRAVRLRRARVAILALTLILSMNAFFPVRTVTGMLQNTGLAVGTLGISIDENRVAFLSSAPNTVGVYDVPSASSASFLLPAGTVLSTPVIISGNRIVVAACAAAFMVCFTAFSALAAAGFPQFRGDIVVWPNAGAGGGPFSIFYCILPNVVPIGPCGAWVAVPSAIPSAGVGFSYYRFSSGVTTPVATAQPIGWLSTNGREIVFPSKSAPAAAQTLMYYDTLAPAPGVFDTGLPVGVSNVFVSIGQETIAFNDNSTTTRIRYYDILRSQASPAGTGPIGTLDPIGTSIWADRIVFRVSESNLGFDCNGNGTISTSDLCLRYWNIHPRSFQVPFLKEDTAPAIPSSSSAIAIYDKVIAFKGTDNNLQMVFVPMKGDVNLDGRVDIVDIGETNICYFKNLLTSSDAPCNET